MGEGRRDDSAVAGGWVAARGDAGDAGQRVVGPEPEVVRRADHRQLGTERRTAGLGAARAGGQCRERLSLVRRQHVVGCEQRDDCDVVERLRGPRRERPQQRRRHGASHVPERGGAGHDCRVADPHADPTPTPTPTPPTGSTQSGWTSGDIGSPLAAGATSVANGTFTVTGGGSDIWDSADQFQFVYQQVTGDAQIVARVASLSAAHPWAKAGVMIRQSLAAGSPHAAMLGTPGSGWSAQSRKSSDGQTTDSSGPSGAPPGWVRLVRAGNVVSAFHSYDGSTWSAVSSETIAMSSSVYVGLAVSAHNSDGATARATFQNVAVQGTIAGSPAPTPPPRRRPRRRRRPGRRSRVGRAATSGVLWRRALTSVANGTFTVTGGGSDIGTAPTSSSSSISR